ncbi:autotransporter outer membrane beta-barrel domain-containing protein [Achromobacter agilis]|uniref:Extracellular serine protease n=1 Tax=Achromobacter agilis TaxID=1353888 RepID=A0A446CRK0_9BURK|nr:autotransporter outer membrane beta-barrel domain-containing protein [Achromobacter agilis]SSW70494.1 Extracellular serine protease [Achromobacter agilis]
MAEGASAACAPETPPACDPGGRVPPSPAAPGPQGWIVAIDNWQLLEGSSAIARIKQRTTGAYAGGEFDAGAGWRLGGALGTTRSRIRIDALDAKANVDSYSATLYGKRSFVAGAGKVNLLAAASYAWHDMDTTRHFDVPGISQTLTADVSANTVLAFTELGYELALSQRASLEPFAGLAFRDVRTRGFSESGGSTAIDAEGSRVVQTTTTLGLRGQTGLSLGPAVGRVHALLGWRRAFGDVAPETTLALDGGSVLTVAGAPIARSAALVGLGAELALSRSAAVGLAYGGQYGDGMREHTASLSLRWAFGSL